MKKLLAALAILGVSLLAGSAKAEEPLKCNPGDVAQGPNCVHESHETHKNPATGRSFTLTFSTAYRPSVGIVLPKTWGVVVQSDDSHLLIVTEMTGSGGGPVVKEATYKWNAQTRTYTNED